MDSDYPMDYFGTRVYLGFIFVGLVGFFSNLLSVYHVRKSVSAKPHFIFLLILDSIVSLTASANILVVSAFFIATNGTATTSGEFLKIDKIFEDLK